jgi:RNA 3'-terminal phosphate cyclase (ATP)
MQPPLDIDGAYGEGGGQLVRNAVALAAITGRDIRVTNIRARRRPAGLAPQHMAAVNAVAALCGARTEGVEPRSSMLLFEPAVVTGGTHRVDIGTAGSMTLVLQAALPVMIAAAKPVSAVIIGGSDVRMAPATDYLLRVLLPLVERMGARVTLEVVKRGYYPQGGGEVRVEVEPSVLRPTAFESRGDIVAVEGVAHVARLPLQIATRMRDAALEGLAPIRGVEASIETSAVPPEATGGAGGAIVVWARSQNTVLGASRVAERGVRAEALGTAVAQELSADVESGASVDIHAADQLLVYFALAGGGSYTTREITDHARTAMWLIEQFVPIRFEVSESGGLARVMATPA